MSNCNDNWKGRDKILHFSVCFLTAIVHPLLAICVALGKEVYDVHKKGNHFCWKDLVWDFLGVLLGSGVHMLLRYFLTNSLL